MIVKSLVLIAAFMSITAAGYHALSLPDVQVSYASNECVEVINYSNTAYDCENMPTKYNHVWVKQ